MLAGMTHDEITNLSVPERLRLIAALWDSIADADIPLSDAQREELERRVANFDEVTRDAVSWETLKAELSTKSR